jgi:sulfur-oxidizing protein SoxY
MLDYLQEVSLAGVPTRRILLRGAAAGTLAALFAPGFAKFAQADTAADASAYPAAAFAQKTEDAAVKAMFNMTATPSTAISFDAPDIAENGAVVPLSISTTLPNVTAIAILAIGNPNTMTAAYQFPAGTNAAVSARIKLAKTTDVIALVQSGGKLYSITKNVKVTLGGCGG